jgi:hypothetical protein
VCSVVAAAKAPVNKGLLLMVSVVASRLWGAEVLLLAESEVAVWPCACSWLSSRLWQK